MNIKSIFLALFVFIFPNIGIADLIQPTAKVTVKVIDSKGDSLIGAKVILQYHVNTGLGKNTKFIEGVTGKDGTFAGESVSIDYCNIGVEKEDYYDSYEKYQFKNISTFNRWEPWNPTIEVIVKKKRNPVPMYAKRTGDLKVPVLEKPVGYDLEKGDWVAPYGKGVVNDFVFNFSTKYVSRREWHCMYKITFPGVLDGIQEYAADNNDRSVYRWPYEAAETGYKSELIFVDLFSSKKKYEPVYDNRKHYIFRVRTKTDDKNNIINANYGKIKGDIELFAEGYVRFEYYFNPTGSRNLEYDSKKPLFKWKTINELNKNKVDGP